MAQQIEEMGRRARAAARALALCSKDKKNAALMAMADALEAAEAEIIAANAQDLEAAPGYGLNAAAVDRLRLDAARIRAMAQGVREVADLPDPCGEILREWTRPNGMKITKIRVPIGVVGIIYESRPNVTADAAVLCPSFYQADLIRNPGWFEAKMHRVRRGIISTLHKRRSKHRLRFTTGATP